MLHYEEKVLYLLKILHQTTTRAAETIYISGCIYLKFYIKPQQCFITYSLACCCIYLKFYIKPQRPLYLVKFVRCCIYLKFYIKPQPMSCFSLIFCLLQVILLTKNLLRGIIGSGMKSFFLPYSAKVTSFCIISKL